MTFKPGDIISDNKGRGSLVLVVVDDDGWRVFGVDAASMLCSRGGLLDLVRMAKVYGGPSSGVATRHLKKVDPVAYRCLRSIDRNWLRDPHRLSGSEAFMKLGVASR